MLFTTSPTLPDACLSAGQTETLVRDLIERRWARLSSDDGDPLAMLFARRQWVAGWDGAGILLLVRERDPADRPRWMLYRNGQLLHTVTESALSRRVSLFRQLLESERLPTLTGEAFLHPLADPLRPEPERRQAAHALLTAMTARPDTLELLGTLLLDTLEKRLGAGVSSPPGTPAGILETLRMQQLTASGTLADVPCQLVRNGVMREIGQLQRLDRLLCRMEAGFRQLSANPLLRPAGEDALGKLSRELHWRQRLRFRLA